MSTEIGITELFFNEEGKITAGSFSPTIQVTLDTKAIEQIMDLKGDSSEKVKESADMTLAAYFTQMNNIEVADREKYRVVSKIDECIKYPSGQVKICRLKYFFEEI